MILTAGVGIAVGGIAVATTATVGEGSAVGAMVSLGMAVGVGLLPTSCGSPVVGSGAAVATVRVAKGDRGVSWSAGGCPIPLFDCGGANTLRVLCAAPDVLIGCGDVHAARKTSAPITTNHRTTVLSFVYGEHLFVIAVIVWHLRVWVNSVFMPIRAHT